jgi:hypothetical protein
MHSVFGRLALICGLRQEAVIADLPEIINGSNSAGNWELSMTEAIQSIGVFLESGERLRQALGFHSKWERNLEAVPPWLCMGTLKRGLGPVPEVGDNALHTRLGIAMADTQVITESRRPNGTNNLFVAWETLTHANNPA